MSDLSNETVVRTRRLTLLLLLLLVSCQTRWVRTMLISQRLRQESNSRSMSEKGLALRGQPELAVVMRPEQIRCYTGTDIMH